MIGPSALIQVTLLRTKICCPLETMIFFSPEQNNPKTWVQCGTSTSSASQYLSSFYFIIYTMMTVGYGDQHADASSQKVSKVGGGVECVKRNACHFRILLHI